MDASEQFWETIEDQTISMEMRIDAIRYLSEDVANQLDQPCCVLYRFRDATLSETYALARAMKDKFGLIVIEYESIYCSSMYLTIMDELREANWPETFFETVFKEMGFLYASEVDPRVLHNLYCLFNAPELEKPLIELPREPATIFKDLMRFHYPNQLTKELTEYHYHPDRIAAWLDAGNELEDYLK